MRNRNLLTLISACFLIGATAGSAAAMFAADSNEFAGFFTALVENAQTGNLSNSFIRVLIPNLLWPVLILSLGFTVLGVIGIPLCVFSKGFLVSYSTSAIIRAFGLDGIWMALLSMGVPNLLYIPLVLIVSVSAMRLAARVDERKPGGVYLARFAVVSVMFSGIAAYQAYIQPKLIVWLVLIST